MIANSDGCHVASLDLAQDAMLVVQRRWDDLEHPGAFLRLTLVNLCRGRRRRWRYERRWLLTRRVETSTGDPEVDEVWNGRGTRPTRRRAGRRVCSRIGGDAPTGAETTTLDGREVRTWSDPPQRAIAFPTACGAISFTTSEAFADPADLTELPGGFTAATDGSATLDLPDGWTSLGGSLPASRYSSTFSLTSEGAATEFNVTQYFGTGIGSLVGTFDAETTVVQGRPALVMYANDAAAEDVVLFTVGDDAVALSGGRSTAELLRIADEMSFHGLTPPSWLTLDDPAVSSVPSCSRSLTITGS